MLVLHAIVATWEYFATAASWDDAQATCESSGGSLLSVLTAEMNAALVEFIAEADPSGESVWVGGNDVAEEVRA